MTEEKGSNVENRVIEVTEARMIELPTVHHKTHGFDRARRLIPGENDVPAWVWEEAKKRKAIAMWIACGILKDKGKGTAKSLADGLNNLTQSEAMKQIAKCGEVKILNDWKASTKNTKLKKACNDRIDELIEAAGANDDK